MICVNFLTVCHLMNHFSSKQMDLIEQVVNLITLTASVRSLWIPYHKNKSCHKRLNFYKTAFFRYSSITIGYYNYLIFHNFPITFINCSQCPINTSTMFG